MYRVVLIGRAGKAKGELINIGKKVDVNAAEKFYDAAAVESLIPQLSYQNALSFDVYIVPIDKAHHYILIDSLKPGATQRLAGLGLAPCLVQSAGKGTQQAVLKVPRLDRSDEHVLVKEAVQQLNSVYTELKFLEVEHPLRMVEFNNKRPGQEIAFTTVVQASHRVCEKTNDLLCRLREEADALAERTRKKREQEQIEANAACQVQRSPNRFQVHFEYIDDPGHAFRLAAACVRTWVCLHGLAVDANGVDLRASVVMLHAGWSEAQVQVGMLTGSDDLVVRHTDPSSYVLDTVTKASITLPIDSQTKVIETSVPRSLRDS